MARRSAPQEALGPRDYAIYAVRWLEIPLISLFLESVVVVLTVRISKLQKAARKISFAQPQPPRLACRLFTCLSILFYLWPGTI